MANGKDASPATPPTRGQQRCRGYGMVPNSETASFAGGPFRMSPINKERGDVDRDSRPVRAGSRSINPRE
jgi:hypothetical protein